MAIFCQAIGLQTSAEKLKKQLISHNNGIKTRASFNYKSINYQMKRSYKRLKHAKSITKSDLSPVKHLQCLKLPEKASSITCTSETFPSILLNNGKTSSYRRSIESTIDKVINKYASSPPKIANGSKMIKVENGEPISNHSVTSSLPKDELPLQSDKSIVNSNLGQNISLYSDKTFNFLSDIKNVENGNQMYANINYQTSIKNLNLSVFSENLSPQQSEENCYTELLLDNNLCNMTNISADYSPDKFSVNSHDFIQHSVTKSMESLMKPCFVRLVDINKNNICTDSNLGIFVRINEDHGSCSESDGDDFNGFEIINDKKKRKVSLELCNSNNQEEIKKENSSVIIDELDNSQILFSQDGQSEIQICDVHSISSVKEPHLNLPEIRISGVHSLTSYKDSGVLEDTKPNEHSSGMCNKEIGFTSSTKPSKGDISTLGNEVMYKNKKINSMTSSNENVILAELPINNACVSKSFDSCLTSQKSNSRCSSESAHKKTNKPSSSKAINKNSTAQSLITIPHVQISSKACTKSKKSKNGINCVNSSTISPIISDSFCTQDNLENKTSQPSATLEAEVVGNGRSNLNGKRKKIKKSLFSHSKWDVHLTPTSSDNNGISEKLEILHGKGKQRQVTSIRNSDNDESVANENIETIVKDRSVRNSSNKTLIYTSKPCFIKSSFNRKFNTSNEIGNTTKVGNNCYRFSNSVTNAACNETILGEIPKLHSDKNFPYKLVKESDSNKQDENNKVELKTKRKYSPKHHFPSNPSNKKHKPSFTLDYNDEITDKSISVYKCRQTTDQLCESENSLVQSNISASMKLMKFPIQQAPQVQTSISAGKLTPAVSVSAHVKQSSNCNNSIQKTSQPHTEMYIDGPMTSNCSKSFAHKDTNVNGLKRNSGNSKMVLSDNSTAKDITNSSITVSPRNQVVTENTIEIMKKTTQVNILESAESSTAIFHHDPHYPMTEISKEISIPSSVLISGENTPLNNFTPVELGHNEHHSVQGCPPLKNAVTNDSLENSNDLALNTISGSTAIIVNSSTCRVTNGIHECQSCQLKYRDLMSLIKHLLLKHSDSSPVIKQEYDPPVITVDDDYCTDQEYENSNILSKSRDGYNSTKMNAVHEFSNTHESCDLPLAHPLNPVAESNNFSSDIQEMDPASEMSHTVVQHVSSNEILPTYFNASAFDKFQDSCYVPTYISQTNELIAPIMQNQHLLEHHDQHISLTEADSVLQNNNIDCAIPMKHFLNTNSSLASGSESQYLSCNVQEQSERESLELGMNEPPKSYSDFTPACASESYTTKMEKLTHFDDSDDMESLPDLTIPDVNHETNQMKNNESILNTSLTFLQIVGEECSETEIRNKNCLQLEAAGQTRNSSCPNKLSKGNEGNNIVSSSDNVQSAHTSVNHGQHKFMISSSNLFNKTSNKLPTKQSSFTRNTIISNTASKLYKKVGKNLLIQNNLNKSSIVNELQQQEDEVDAMIFSKTAHKDNVINYPCPKKSSQVVQNQHVRYRLPNLSEAKSFQSSKKIIHLISDGSNNLSAKIPSSSVAKQSNLRKPLCRNKNLLKYDSHVKSLTKNVEVCVTIEEKRNECNLTDDEIDRIILDSQSVFEDPANFVTVINGFTKYSCPHCSFYTGTSLLLKQHLMSDHNDILKKFRCLFCKKHFYDSNSLKLHLKDHENILKFTCPNCTASFPDSQALKSHACNFPGNLLTCTKCYESFSTKLELINHEESNRNRLKRLKCLLCLATFKYNCQYHLHIRNAHSENDRPHECSQCHATFKQAFSLLVHMWRHKKLIGQ